ncbi:hypothetical protein HKCCE4037_09185 [Rhodobacterales bacterium HKCCE4037]|nr:hypothetical protein [Rhodobacterales bacterium HKCCE4037]
MTDMPDEKDNDLLAAEYALGLISDDQIEAARAMLRDDPAFARQVTAWEMRLADLGETLEPVQPSPAVKRELIARILPGTQHAGIWQRLALWRGAAVLAVLALVAVLIFPVSLPDPVPTDDGPLYSAEIVSAEGDFRVVAVVDTDRDEVLMTLTEGAAPEGRILQVWAHGPGEPAESVGLWPDGNSVRLPMPENIRRVSGVLTLGVSEEPPGGSPTGSPSGRVFGTVDIPGVRVDG